MIDPTSVFDRPIAFQRGFVFLGCGITGALMLSQAVYWSKRTNDPDGWFYKTAEEWEAETGMTRREQETARTKLSASGVLCEKKQGLPCKLFYRVDFEELLRQCGYGETSLHESAKQGSTEVPNRSTQKRQSSTENTTENTTDINQPNGSASGDAVGCPKCIEAGTIIADCWICAGTGKEEPKPTTTTDKPETVHQSQELFETQTKPEVPPTDKTINIPFDDWWRIYGKKIDRKKCERKWGKLSNKTRLAIMEHTPKYVRATPDAQYRKNPSTYLNSETWNDEQLPAPSQGWPNPSYPTNQNQTKVDVDAAMAPKAVRRQESTPEQLKRNQEQAANLLNIFKGD